MRMVNYAEYRELLESYSDNELFEVYDAIYDVEKEAELAENGSSLLVFLTDVDLQEQLLLYLEDKYRIPR